MFSIDSITASPSQKFSVPLATGIINITLNYKPAIQMWFADIVYNDFSFYGLRITKNYNILEQFSKTLPFGIWMEVLDDIEPIFLDDFTTGRATMFILEPADLDTIEAFYASNK